MKRIKVRLREFLQKPQVTVFLGILVCACGVSEVLEEVLVGFDGILKAAHGLIAFGIVSALKGLLELAEGIELVTIEMEEVEREEAEDATVAASSEAPRDRPAESRPLQRSTN